MIETYGYALKEADGTLAPFRFERQSPGDTDILMEILYCGICHTDLLSAHDGLGRSTFPMVPGHEIVGRVIGAGSAVSRFRVGDMAGIGCIIDSCRSCPACRDGDEQYCNNDRFTPSFNGHYPQTGAPTYGGYSKHYVIDEKYAIQIPEHMDAAAAAPLLCGGITTYRPLKRYQVGPGQRVGVLGLGGLGHLGIRFAKAFGASPVMLTSSPSKVNDALLLGADDVILTSDASQMAAAIGSLDFILDTVSAPHDPNPYLGLLKRNGTMCLVGIPEQPLSLNSTSLVFGDKTLSGSLIGGIEETREMMSFCADHGIKSEIEIIAMDYVNEAWARIEKNDVKYRFVIDMATLTD